MTSSQNQDSEGKKPAGEPAASVSQKRRRLIKGAAAAAPGIFTLYSGNAQAMASTYQCIARTRDAFTGDQEYAGEGHGADGFVRLAEGPGIRVVRPSLSNPREERWLIEVDGAFFEAGQEQQTGASWNKVLNGDQAWLVVPGPINPRRFREPGTNLQFVEDVSQPPTVQVLACVDDNGNVVSANPQHCDDLGLTPTSGSCWASFA
jgi:hypothetical protein